MSVAGVLFSLLPVSESVKITEKLSFEGGKTEYCRIKGPTCNI